MSIEIGNWSIDDDAYREILQIQQVYGVDFARAIEIYENRKAWGDYFERRRRDARLRALTKGEEG